MQASIVGDMKITPSEVRNYYKNIPKDSLPKIEATVKLNQIVVYPPESEEAVFEVKEKMLALRQRILNGESFAALAVLYSEGPSATNGGELGFFGKGELDPEYVKAAFSLKEGGVSKIVESSFGYHIIQLIERRDNRVNTRHIIMKPKVSSESLQKAESRLDSISELIRLDSLTFEQAARYFSEDEDTRLSGGQMINLMNTGNAQFQMNHLDKQMFQIVRDLKLGEISDPILTEDNNGKKVFKIVKLTERTDPHVANLKQDYDLLKNMALSEKQQEVVQEWIKEKIKSTYVSIDDSYANCDFGVSTWKK
jgi:peptidyl-prolyl cis-trans isomerase SurA